MSQFTTGQPITLDDLTRIVADITADADVQYRDTYGGVACFQVVGVSPGSLHRIYSILRNAGVSVRANDSGAVPSVLVREAPPVAAPEPAAEEAPAVDTIALAERTLRVATLTLEAAEAIQVAKAAGDLPGVVLLGLNLARDIEQLFRPLELVTDAPAPNDEARRVAA